MEGWDFEITIGNQPIRHASNISIDYGVSGSWPNSFTVRVCQCQYCGKTYGENESVYKSDALLLCDECRDLPDRPPIILCSQCGKRLTEIIGVSRKYYRCAPCKRELGR